MVTLVSGGADGADKEFEKYAILNKHNVLVCKEPHPEYHQELITLNIKYIHRKYPTNNNYIDMLLQRNIEIAKKSNIVYAIGYIQIINNKCYIEGGTIWASYYAILKSIPLYFYNQIEINKLEVGWYFLFSHNDDIIFSYAQSVPKINNLLPDTKYAGIGTRRLLQNGKDAIAWLYSS